MSSFRASVRIRIEDIEEFSKKQLDRDVLQSLHQELEKKTKIQKHKNTIFPLWQGGGSQLQSTSQKTLKEQHIEKSFPLLGKGNWYQK